MIQAKLNPFRLESGRIIVIFQTWTHQHSFEFPRRGRWIWAATWKISVRSHSEDCSVVTHIMILGLWKNTFSLLIDDSWSVKISAFHWATVFLWYHDNTWATWAKKVLQLWHPPIQWTLLIQVRNHRLLINLLRQSHQLELLWSLNLQCRQNHQSRLLLRVPPCALRGRLHLCRRGWLPQSPRARPRTWWEPKRVWTRASRIPSTFGVRLPSMATLMTSNHGGVRKNTLKANM